MIAITRLRPAAARQSHTHPWLYNQNPMGGAMATAITDERPQYAIPSPRREGGTRLVRYAADAASSPDQAMPWIGTKTNSRKTVGATA